MCYARESGEKRKPSQKYELVVCLFVWLMRLFDKFISAGIGPLDLERKALSNVPSMPSLTIIQSIMQLPFYPLATSYCLISVNSTLRGLLVFP